MARIGVSSLSLAISVAAYTSLFFRAQSMWASGDGNPDAPQQSFKIYLNEPPGDSEYESDGATRGGQAMSTNRNERSVVFVLQERLSEQAILLTQLKDVVAEMRTTQSSQQKIIDDLHKKVNDHTWGIASLKTAQELTDTNTGQVKERCDSLLAAHSVDKANTSQAIAELAIKMSILEQTQEVTAQVIRHLISEGLENNTFTIGRAEIDSEHVKELPPVGRRGNDEKTIAFEEQLVSSAEEENNRVDQQLRTWTRVEETLRHSLAALRQDTRRHEDDLLGLKSVVADTGALALRLHQDQQAVQNASLLAALNETTADLRARLVDIELQLKELATDRDDMASMETTVAGVLQLTKLTSERFATFQQHSAEQNQVNELQMRALSSEIGHMNVTLRAMADNELANLYSNVTVRTNAVKERNDMLWSRIRIVDSRLALVEVRYLQEELSECRRASDDLSHKLRLREVEDHVKAIEDALRGYLVNYEQLSKTCMRLESTQKASSDSVAALQTAYSALNRELPHLQKVMADVDSLVNNLPRDCSDEFGKGSHRDGSYLIRPANSSAPVKVQCIMDTLGWLVVQRRQFGQVSFDRNWTEYRNGFGDPETGDFWLGNDRLHKITSQGNYTVRFDLWTANKTYAYAEYQNFRVLSESRFFRLEVGDTYRGNATDSFLHSNGMAFSTKDADNDASSTNCAAFYTAGWWYKHCQYCNLNGRYTVGMVWFNQDLDEWVELSATTIRLRRT